MQTSDQEHPSLHPRLSGGRSSGRAVGALQRRSYGCPLVSTGDPVGGDAILPAAPSFGSAELRPPSTYASLPSLSKHLRLATFALVTGKVISIPLLSFVNCLGFGKLPCELRRVGSLVALSITHPNRVANYPSSPGGQSRFDKLEAPSQVEGLPLRQSARFHLHLLMLSTSFLFTRRSRFLSFGIACRRPGATGVHM